VNRVPPPNVKLLQSVKKKQTKMLATQTWIVPGVTLMKPAFIWMMLALVLLVIHLIRPLV